jgi:hypothetical protein
MKSLVVLFTFSKHTCVRSRSSRLDDWRYKDMTASVAVVFGLISSVNVPLINLSKEGSVSEFGVVTFEEMMNVLGADTVCCKLRDDKWSTMNGK